MPTKEIDIRPMMIGKTFFMKLVKFSSAKESILAVRETAVINASYASTNKMLKKNVSAKILYRFAFAAA